MLCSCVERRSLYSLNAEHNEFHILYFYYYYYYYKLNESNKYKFYPVLPSAILLFFWYKMNYSIFFFFFVFFLFELDFEFELDLELDLEFEFDVINAGINGGGVMS